MAVKKNVYMGETLAITMTVDEVFDVTETGQPFKIFLYPNGIDMTLEENKRYVKTIDSRDTTSLPSYGDGYIERTDDPQTIVGFIPYAVTKEMEEGPYTLEILYGDKRRTVLKENSAFVMTKAFSKTVN